MPGRHQPALALDPCYDAVWLLTFVTPTSLAISLGDPAGIGPEVVVRALARRAAAGGAERPVVIYGDVGVLERTAAAAGLPAPRREDIRSVTRLTPDELRPGHPDALSGRAQVEYLRAATQAVLRGEHAGLVTAPISKEWAGRAGFTFPGHTEYLAEAAGVADFAMMLAGPRLRVTLATTHLALREVPSALSAGSIARAIILTVRSLRQGFGVALPRVAVAGLNPHAGEAGRFGDEESRLVVPAIEQARRELGQQGVAAEVSGPHVPDVVFRQAADGAFDVVVALYHDQGLIPVKLLHFDDAVNVTLGLPFVRTSPDHGTAYDIAGTNRARPDSFLAALQLATVLTGARTGNVSNGDGGVEKTPARGGGPAG
jgi:4-hydroxythreonine-4-phosphate dehydrogenase